MWMWDSTIKIYEHYEHDILTKSALHVEMVPFVPLRCPALVCLFIGEMLLGLYKPIEPNPSFLGLPFP